MSSEPQLSPIPRHDLGQSRLDLGRVNQVGGEVRTIEEIASTADVAVDPVAAIRATLEEHRPSASQALRNGLDDRIEHRKVFLYSSPPPVKPVVDIPSIDYSRTPHISSRTE